jgi:DNA-binding transcriptional regulator YhcF (GntR family)
MSGPNRHSARQTNPSSMSLRIPSTCPDTACAADKEREAALSRVEDIGRRRGNQLSGPRELPPLSEMPLNGSLMAANAIYRILRNIALQKRCNNPQRFYSIRSVANHFHVPQSTVSRIYRRLASENILRTVWGSQTFVSPLESAELSRSRSLGLAISLRRFILDNNYRRAILEVQRRIWRYGARERMLFYDDSEELVLLCKRVHLSPTAIMICIAPEGFERQAMLRVNDQGWTVVCFDINYDRGAIQHTQVSRKLARLVSPGCRCRQPQYRRKKRVMRGGGARN